MRPCLREWPSVLEVEDCMSHPNSLHWVPLGGMGKDSCIHTKVDSFLNFKNLPDIWTVTYIAECVDGSC